jgi:hypothetical protein
MTWGITHDHTRRHDISQSAEKESCVQAVRISRIDAFFKSCTVTSGREEETGVVSPQTASHGRFKLPDPMCIGVPIDAFPACRYISSRHMAIDFENQAWILAPRRKALCLPPGPLPFFQDQLFHFPRPHYCCDELTFYLCSTQSSWPSF